MQLLDKLSIVFPQNFSGKFILYVKSPAVILDEMEAILSSPGLLSNCAFKVMLVEESIAPV